MKIPTTRLTVIALLSSILACTESEPLTEEPVQTMNDMSYAADDAEGGAEAPMADAAAPAEMSAATPPFNTERYRSIEEQGFKDPVATPLSTFSIDVDTASYSLVRRFLTDGRMPPSGAVRIEEMLNYFDYQYQGPKTDDQPFAIHATVAAAPWQPDHRLVRIGIKGKEMPARERRAANLVFLVDVSGSMDEPNKLPLLQRSLEMLVRRLNDADTVGLVVYAGASGVVLKPTSDKDEITAALEKLRAGGSTNGASGIETAYDLAERHFKKNGINRVILATDGDFNVGVTSESALVRLIEEKASKGIFLSVLGFGSGNYNDSMMEQLADKGDGNYAYIDTLDEARKVLVEQISGTLVTIAKDVKIQVEFNPAVVTSYRLIGYENRALASEDFNDDEKDAGEIGAGHTVTALYEVVTKDSKDAPPGKVDPPRYQTKTNKALQTKDLADEMMLVKVRFKRPEGGKSQLLTRKVKDENGPADRTDADFRFAAAVAGFGMKLRGSPNARDFDYDQILKLAKSGRGEDDSGLRSEFVNLVRKAEALDAH